MDKSTLQIVISAKDEVSKELKKVQGQLKKVSTELNKMKKVGGTASKSVSKDLKKIGNEGFKAKEKIKGLIGTLQGLGALRLFTAIGIGLFVRQLGMAINNLANEFVEFENEMRRVNTITRLGSAGFENMTKEVAAMSTIVPKSTKELASGLFDIASAGVDAGDQMVFLGVSARLATAGFFDTATAVQGLTAVIKGYGLEFSDATRIADLFFKTNELGQTTVAEIALSIQELTSNAKESGIGVEELFTIFGTFTGVTGNASRVATQFKGALNALAKATPEVSKLQDALNQRLRALGKDELQLGRNVFVGKNFAEVSRQIVDAVDGDVQALRRLIPEIEATNLIMAAAGGQFDIFNQKLIQTMDAAGSMEQGFTESLKSIENQTIIAQQRMKFFFFEIGKGTAGAKLALSKGLLETMFAVKQLFIAGKVAVASFSLVIVDGMEKAINSVNFLKETFFSLVNFIGNLPSKLLGKLGLEGISEKLSVDIGAENKVAEQFSKDLVFFKQGLNEAIIEFGDEFDATEKSRLNGAAQFEQFTRNLESLQQEIAEARDSFDLDGLAKGAGSADKSINALLKTIQGINSTLQDFDDAFKKAEESGSASMGKLRNTSLQKIGALDQSIRQVTQRLADLRTEFEKTKGTDIQGLAESFANAEERVKELKEQLIRATDIQQIFDIKTQIAKEEDALEKTKDVRKQFTEEIANAQRRAGLSDLERAIEDFTIKRGLAQQEFEENQSRLQADRQAIVSKRNLEIQAFIASQAEAKVQLENKLKDITKEKEEFVKKVEKELKLEGDKAEVLKELFKEAADFREKTVTDSSNAIQGTISAEAALWERLATAIAKATGSRSFAGFQTNTVPLGNFDTGGTVPQTGLFRLHQGETVLTRRESRNDGTVIVNITGGTFLSEEAAEAMGDMIIDKLKTNIKI